MMETKEWTNVDKSDWGDGPWQNEPDKMQWPDHRTGYPCLLVRSYVTGAWCGYVGVTRGHPAYGKGYDDVDASAHGGLTFAGGCQPGAEDHGICHAPGEGEPDDVWWFGFDFAHAGDLAPKIEATKRQLGTPDFMSAFELPPDVYAPKIYVMKECVDLAEQLAAMK